MGRRNGQAQAQQPRAVQGAAAEGDETEEQRRRKREKEMHPSPLLPPPVVVLSFCPPLPVALLPFGAAHRRAVSRADRRPRVVLLLSKSTRKRERRERERAPFFLPVFSLRRPPDTHMDDDFVGVVALQRGDVLRVVGAADVDGLAHQKRLVRLRRTRGRRRRRRKGEGGTTKGERVPAEMAVPPFSSLSSLSSLPPSLSLSRHSATAEAKER